jgi:RNA polymerase sigma factor (sigma-70 family)
MNNEKSFSNLGIYGNDIKKYKLLTIENEKKLCFEMANGNLKSRNELITSNLSLVIKIATKYKNMGVELDELVCEGNKGLITAATRFNPSLDNKFSTYAYFWIKQSILAALDSNKQWSSLSNDNVMNYDDYTEKDLIVDMNEFEEDEQDGIKDIIRKIDGLPKRDSSIVKHYFGISGYTELNTVELSEKFNISTMRVSNIIENSIRKIRCQILENF